MTSAREIWAAVLWEAPVYGHDELYLASQARILKLDQERLSKLWHVCEQQAKRVLEVFEAFDCEVITRKQVEQVIAGTFSIERVRRALVNVRSASELDALIS